MRHIDPSQLQTMLNAGKRLEQWLGSRIADGERIIRWVELTRERNGEYAEYVVCFQERLDVGHHEYVDVWSFPPVDDDNEDGETEVFDELALALDHAALKLGAKRELFVGSGVVQDEYADFLKREGLAPTREE
jgi:hypothetical protein